MEGPIEGLKAREPPFEPTTYAFDPPLQIDPPGPDCERCSTMMAVCLGHGKASQFRRFVLHRGRAELDQGVRSRCWWCLRVARQITRFETGKDAAGSPFLTEFQCAWSPDQWYGVSVETLTEGLGFHVYGLVPGASVPAQLLLTDQEDDSGTSGASAWTYVSERLRACVESHPECRLGEPWVPTRLIEVTPAGGEALHFRVVFTMDWKVKEMYISVSHRWGGNKMPRLTSATFDAYQQCIPVEVLPQKFVDAGKVAMRLGIKYLWIDSLCIIQDSVDDWEDESAQMHRVYRQGFCNLSAASADLNDDGLFYDRDVAWHHPHVIYPRTQDQPLLVMENRDERWFQKLDEEPLYSRSWVCQERLLSTRNISFTKDLIFFECARDLSSEASDLTRSLLSEFLPPEEAQKLRSAMSYFAGFRAPFNDSPSAETGTTPPFISMKTLGAGLAPHRYWQRVVEMYSRCRITVPTDKLVALAGVTRAFHETTGAAYAAGLWADNLIEDLAWYTLADIPAYAAADVPIDYIAPSWSWASVWSPALFFGGSGPSYPLAECRGVVTVPHGRDALGRVKSGSLRLLCYVVHFELEEPGWATLQKALEDLCQPGDSWMEFHGGFDREGEAENTVGHTQKRNYFVVPLFYAHADVPPGEDNIPSDDVVPILVLEACTPAWGFYRRVGIFHVHVFHRASDDPPEGVGNLEETEPESDDDLPAVCQQAKSRGLRPVLCRALGRAVKVARGANIPSLENARDGRHVITII